MSANISPLSSKITLKQSAELMSQLYSPPVTFDFWPLKAFALGAPTSSLQQKHQWPCKDVWGSIKCTLRLSSICTHLHSCLLSRVPLIYYAMTHSSLLCNNSSHIQRHICHQTDVPCPHGPTESKTLFKCLLWTRLPISLHTHTEAAFVEHRQGQMPHPRLGDWHPVPRVYSGVNQSRMSSFKLLLFVDVGSGVLGKSTLLIHQSLALSLSVCCRNTLACCVCLMTSRVNVIQHTVFTRWD